MSSLEEMMREHPELRQIFPGPYREPDTRLAVDMGRKAYNDAMDAVRRNAALTGNPIEATVVALTSLSALSAAYADLKRKVMEGEDIPADSKASFKELIDKIDNNWTTDPDAPV